MAYWVKVKYERNLYIVDLDCVSAFVCASNGRITFWLPDSTTSIVITKLANPDDYQKLLDYTDKIVESSLVGSWVKIFYDRNDYIINLNRISSFCYSYNDKITFWLPDSTLPIILTKQANFKDYKKIVNFIKNKTGHSFS